MSPSMLLLAPTCQVSAWRALPAQAMWHDALHAMSCGVHGIVLGMLTEEGNVATDQL